MQRRQKKRKIIQMMLQCFFLGFCERNYKCFRYHFILSSKFQFYIRMLLENISVARLFVHLLAGWYEFHFMIAPVAATGTADKDHRYIINFHMRISVRLHGFYYYIVVFYYVAVDFPPQ